MPPALSAAWPVASRMLWDERLKVRKRQYSKRRFAGVEPLAREPVNRF
jgi:hypothetical protein